MENPCHRVALISCAELPDAALDNPPLRNCIHTMSTATAESPRIELAQAVQIARSYLADAYRDQHPQGVLLEEVELSDDDAYWLITLGFDNPHQRGPIAAAFDPLAEIMRPREPRIYKTIKVDAKTGRVVSMKIRPV